MSLKIVSLWLLLVALVGVYYGTSLPVWMAMRSVGLREKDLTRVLADDREALREAPLREEETPNLQLLLAEVAQLRAELRQMKERASEEYVKVSDWALQSSGASIDTKRTSETYDFRESLGCWIRWLFYSPSPPDTILQPDVTPGHCWPFRGHQGQVVIRLPARVHLTAITLQHISKEISPSGTVISAPRDVVVFGVDADGEEETLLGTFTYNVAKEPMQTFPLKNAPFPRPFSYIKLLVRSNWGNPDYTCMYRVQVHGKMAKPEGVNGN